MNLRYLILCAVILSGILAYLMIVPSCDSDDIGKRKDNVRERWHSETLSPAALSATAYNVDRKATRAASSPTPTRHPDTITATAEVLATQAANSRNYVATKQARLGLDATATVVEKTAIAEYTPTPTPTVTPTPTPTPLPLPFKPTPTPVPPPFKIQKPTPVPISPAFRCWTDILPEVSLKMDEVRFYNVSNFVYGMYGAFDRDGNYGWRVDFVASHWETGERWLHRVQGWTSVIPTLPSQKCEVIIRKDIELIKLVSWDTDATPVAERIGASRHHYGCSYSNYVKGLCR